VRDLPLPAPGEGATLGATTTPNPGNVGLYAPCARTSAVAHSQVDPGVSNPPRIWRISVKLEESAVMAISRPELGKKYTFVTVVYEAEYPLLLLHARSMRLYCPLELVEKIIVVDNCERDLSPRLKNVLLTEYGHLKDYLTLVSFREIGQMNQVSGYDRQQIIKS
jgi:hypothetical protein